MSEKCNFWNKKRFFKRETGFLLNHLTLQISDPVIWADFNNERTLELDKVFVYAVVLGILNTLFQLGCVFIIKQFELYLVISSCMFNVATLFWAVIRLRVKWVPRIIIPLFFLSYCILCLFTAFQEPGTIWRGHLDLESVNIQMITVFAIMVFLLTHTDFYIVLCFYAPVYIISQSLIISRRIAAEEVQYDMLDES